MPELRSPETRTAATTRDAARARPPWHPSKARDPAPTAVDARPGQSSGPPTSRSENAARNLIPRPQPRRQSGWKVKSPRRNNGPTFSGRAGTGRDPNDEDRDARPVRCNGWLSRTARCAAAGEQVDVPYRPPRREVEGARVRVNRVESRSNHSHPNQRDRGAEVAADDTTQHFSIRNEKFVQHAIEYCRTEGLVRRAIST